MKQSQQDIDRINAIIIKMYRIAYDEAANGLGPLKDDEIIDLFIFINQVGPENINKRLN